MQALAHVEHGDAFQRLVLQFLGQLYHGFDATHLVRLVVQTVVTGNLTVQQFQAQGVVFLHVFTSQSGFVVLQCFAVTSRIIVQVTFDIIQFPCRTNLAKAHLLHNLFRLAPVGVEVLVNMVFIHDAVGQGCTGLSAPGKGKAGENQCHKQSNDKGFKFYLFH